MPDYILLNGIPLNNSMEYLERHGQSRVGQSTRRLLDGPLIINTTVIPSGFPITLEATEEYGWLTLAKIKLLELLAATPGEVMTLQIYVDTYNVIFRHNEPPAIDMRPLIPRVNESDSDYFIGKLKFLTI